ncbi:MAG TPA: hypothetical protein PLL75_02665 [Candidatus Omnitrophota bacterium]|nr:hypothetical protein [Candidatus Omnitrophota bacterium]HPS36614.1 hypothetical protein [Candidatus Omnitrophota bacterium]
MKKITVWVLFSLMLLGATALDAVETVKKPSAFKQILDVQERGIKNIFTSGGEFIRVAKLEPKTYPKAWPVTYIPRAFMNTAVRLSSGISDVLVLPVYMIQADDSRPITRHFDLPDYCWDKE